jgi:hypothetical protein
LGGGRRCEESLELAKLVKGFDLVVERMLANVLAKGLWEKVEGRRICRGAWGIRGAARAPALWRPVRSIL